VLLEQRIRDAPDNVAAFRGNTGANSSAEQQIMINSPFACAACHQQ